MTRQQPTLRPAGRKDLDRKDHDRGDHDRGDLERGDIDLAALQRQDATAWAKFYDALAGPLLGYLRGMGAAEPEDVLGETFMQVARDLPRFTGGPGELRPWVYTIARHRLIDAARARQRRPSDPEDFSAAEADNRSDLHGSGDLRAGDLHGSGVDDYERILDRDLLRTLLDDLTEDQREIIWMRFFLDLDTSEVGAITGRSANAVAALTARALTRLHLGIQALTTG